MVRNATWIGRIPAATEVDHPVKLVVTCCRCLMFMEIIFTQINCSTHVLISEAEKLYLLHTQGDWRMYAHYIIARACVCLHERMYAWNSKRQL